MQCYSWAGKSLTTTGAASVVFEAKAGKDKLYYLRRSVVSGASVFRESLQSMPTLFIPLPLLLAATTLAPSSYSANNIAAAATTTTTTTTMPAAHLINGM